MILTVSIPDNYFRRLQEIAAERQRTVEDLAESAITEAVIDNDRRTPPSGKCWLNQPGCSGRCGSYGCEGR